MPKRTIDIAIGMAAGAVIGVGLAPGFIYRTPAATVLATLLTLAILGRIVAGRPSPPAELE